MKRDSPPPFQPLLANDSSWEQHRANLQREGVTPERKENRQLQTKPTPKVREREEEERRRFLDRIAKSVDQLNTRHLQALVCPPFTKRVARLQLVLGGAMLNLLATFDSSIALSNDNRRLHDAPSLRTIHAYASNPERALSHFRLAKEYLLEGNRLPPHFEESLRKALNGPSAVSAQDIDAEFHALRAKQFDNAKRRTLHAYQLGFQRVRAALSAFLPPLPAVDNANKHSTSQKPRKPAQ